MNASNVVVGFSYGGGIFFDDLGGGAFADGADDPFGLLHSLGVDPLMARFIKIDNLNNILGFDTSGSLLWAIKARR
jgi:hypothetical protein